MKYWSLPLFAFSLLLSKPIFARHLVVGLGLPSEHILWPKLQNYMNLVADKADKDLQLELKSTPYLRLQDLLSKGDIDGDLGRLTEAYEANPSVVRVDESASMLRLYLIFSKDQVMADLETIRRYKTVAAKDSYFHKRACKELKLQCEFVGPGSSSMDMLRLRRVGSVISTQFQVPEHMRQGGDPQLFRLSDKAYYMEPIYLFLAKKNADLAVKLGSAMKELKQDGTYKKIFDSDP